MVLPDSNIRHQLPVVTTAPESPDDVTMRIFGSLRPECDALGLPSQFRLIVPTGGVTGSALATFLGLPAEKIEGIFINRVVRPISDVVRPGDRVAFVPYDTPGPHRFFLGIYAAGKSGHSDFASTVHDREGGAMTRFENDEATSHPLMTEMEAGTYAWCACGKTKTVPYCDGSHEGSGITPLEFDIETAGTYAICNCGLTKNPPFCDGSHVEIE